MTINRRLLSLAIALIAAAFFVVVYRSTPQNQVTHAPISQAPSAATSTTLRDTTSVSTLKMSRRLTNVSNTPAPVTSDPTPKSGASLTRPILLFLLAFASGWWLRQWIRGYRRPTVTVTPGLGAHLSTDSDVASNDQANSELDEAPFPTVLLPAAEITDDSIDEDLSNTAQIEVLQEKNIGKAKIIKALENVVKENREKWIAWDETEARLTAQVDELKRELNNAMRQAFRTSKPTGDKDPE